MQGKDEEEPDGPAPFWAKLLLTAVPFLLVLGGFLLERWLL